MLYLTHKERIVFMLSENRIKYYLNIARNLCYFSDNKKAKLGCVLVYKNKIISTGYNLQNKTNPLQKKYNGLRGYNPNASFARNTVHAECYALLRAKNLEVDWRKVNVFVFRIKKDGSRGLAKPCEACEAMLKMKGVQNIYYSTESGYCYERYE